MQKGSHTTAAIVVLGALFFLFGFTTWLNGPLIGYLKIICELKDGAEPFYVTLAFYIAYFVTALPMSWVLQRTGMKRGMMYGLFTMALGAILFVPAANERSYDLFLVGLFVIGTGLSLLQTAINPYVTVVGPIDSAAARISIMGICNKMAGVLAPLALGFVLLGDADTLETDLITLGPLEYAARLDEVANRVIIPYAAMALVLVGLGFLVLYSPLPELDPEVEEPLEAKEVFGVFRFPNLVLGVIALFLYVGVEVMAGDTIGLYGRSQGMTLEASTHLTSYTLACMVAGYLIGIVGIPRYFSQSTALAASAILGVVFTLAAIFLHGEVSVYCIALLGLANALVWPAIWPLAISGLGHHTKTGSALLIMAIAGGAILPLVYGSLAGVPSIGHQQAYWIMVPCYLFMGWYGLKGARILRW